MATNKNQSVYEEVVQVTHVYLGPAADRFIARQVESHLQKPPARLSRSDLRDLIDWIRAVVSLLTEDTEIIEEYISELEKLTVAKRSPSK